MQRIAKVPFSGGLICSLLVVLGSGCQNVQRARVIDHTAWVPDPANTVGLRHQYWEPSQDSCQAEPGTPLVSIEAWFLDLEPQLVPQQLKDAADGVTVFSSADLRALLVRTREVGTSSSVECPKLSVFSGKSAAIRVERCQSFIKEPGFIVPRIADGLSENPTVGALRWGRTLAVRPRVEKDDVVIEHMEAQAVHLLGMRECSAWVERCGRRRPVYWSEPVFIDHSTPASLSSIQLKEGEAIAIRLPAQVVQPAARVRMETVAGAVWEKYASERKTVGFGRGASPTPTSPLECLVLLTARRGPPGETDGNSPQQATQDE